MSRLPFTGRLLVGLSLGLAKTGGLVHLALCKTGTVVKWVFVFASYGVFRLAGWYLGSPEAALGALAVRLQAPAARAEAAAALETALEALRQKEKDAADNNRKGPSA